MRIRRCECKPDSAKGGYRNIDADDIPPNPRPLVFVSQCRGSQSRKRCEGKRSESRPCQKLSPIHFGHLHILCSRSLDLLCAWTGHNKSTRKRGLPCGQRSSEPWPGC